MSNQRIRYKMFRGIIASWERLFEQAAKFGSSLKPDRLISISHSEDGNDGIVTVWYWE